MTSGRRLALVLGVGLPLISLLLCAGWVCWQLVTPYAGWQGPAVVVELEHGMPASVMLERLRDAGVLRTTWPLRLWLGVRGGAERLHRGEYRFDAPYAPLDVLRTLELGRVWLHAVTLPEGLSMDETARRLADAGLSDYDSLLAAFRDPAPVRALAPDAADLEGFLFPDTYHFPRDVSPGQIVGSMVERFRSRAAPGAEEGSGAARPFDRAAAAVGLTVLEAVTLASMIEKETGLDDERPRVSRVFHNRLARGMRLQCDPTVRYALRRAGQPVERLLHKHLQFDSPWNTYVIDGLPPGPICSPGASSLWAAVLPADGEELYFVAKPGGGHRFSEDLESHQEAVREWRRYVRSSM